MAGALNKVMLIGHLGADPEIRYTQKGAPVATLSLATSESWTGNDGVKQEKTEWHRVIAFGKLAELCQSYLKKGRQVYAEGRLQTRQWDDRDGNKRYTTEIVAREILFIGGRGADAGVQSGSYNNNYNDNQISAPSMNNQADNFGGGGMPEDDDYPF
jgi:single-strand DNA-binding protein